MSETTEEIAEMVRISTGDRVDIDTKVCVEQRLNYNSCVGCPSELGCAKVTSTMLVLLSSSGYKPKSYDDYELMSTRIDEKMDKILSAKTVEEAKNGRHRTF